MKLVAILVLTLAAASAFSPRKSPQPSGRIANGLDANDGQFPYQVGLLIKNGFLASWCGGSIIGDEWVLTAAHCTEEATSVNVILGQCERQAGKGITHKVKANHIYIHEDWDSKTLKNDISLIRIPRTKFTDHIQPVALPSFTDQASNLSGELALISGWGRTSDEYSDLPSWLQWAEVEISSQNVCSKKYGSKIVTDNHVCVATKEAGSTCRGDSGGPLVLESSNVLIGLTSFGAASGCEKGHPVVFTRIEKYMDWIVETTGRDF